MTRVVNKNKEKYDVYVGRPSIFGNPYILKDESERDLVIARYKKYFYNRLETDSEFKEKILELKNKTLGCFCSPRKCHGDVIKEYLDK